MPEIEEDGKSWLRRPKLYKGVVQPYKEKKKKKKKKKTISFVMSVRLSVRMEKLGSHWKDFHEI